MKEFGINIEKAGKAARNMRELFIVDGKPIVETYAIRAFLRDIAAGKKKIVVIIKEEEK